MMMIRYILVLAFIMSSVLLIAQKEIKQELPISSVKVFKQNAQIFRSGDIEMGNSTEKLILTGISPHIIESSFSIGGDGDFQIIAIRPMTDFLDTLASKDKFSSLNSVIKELNTNLDYLNANAVGLAEERSFMLSNRDLFNLEENFSLEKLKNTASYFRIRLEEIEIEKIKLEGKRDSLMKLRAKHENQLSALRPDPTSIPLKQMEIEVISNSMHTATVEISYVVNQAGWLSEYDLKVDKLSDGVELFHKAVIFQKTEVPWNNLDLFLSTAEPQLSAEEPLLQPWILGESYTYRNIERNIDPYALDAYDPNKRTISGYVIEKETGESIFYATITVFKDGAIVDGFYTDSDGSFVSKELSAGVYDLEISYVGYNTILTKGLDLRTRSKRGLKLEMSAGVLLKEIAVVEYKKPLTDITSFESSRTVSSENIRNIVSRTGGVDIGNIGKSKLEEERIIRSVSSTQLDRTTSMEYSLSIPISVSPDGTPKTVTIEEKILEAEFEYHCVPKIDLNAYLIARITDWEQYSLPKGKTSLYFEDTYVGKMFLNFENKTEDTLSVSLGRDQNISIDRKRTYKKTKKPLVGKKTTEFEWEISMRNTKSEAVSILLYDQIPVSPLKEVTIESKNGGAALNKETGELVWDFELKPKQEVKKSFSYTAQYPKWYTVELE